MRQKIDSLPIKRAQKGGKSGSSRSDGQNANNGKGKRKAGGSRPQSSSHHCRKRGARGGAGEKDLLNMRQPKEETKNKKRGKGIKKNHAERTKLGPL